MDEYRYEVINVATGENHGPYPTLDQAKGCVEFDHLSDWEIWRDGTCIEYSNQWS